jgi:UDP-3-O-[3-hydroxymyristoyl] glucosamine N-acyltransferase
MNVKLENKFHRKLLDKILLGDLAKLIGASIDENLCSDNIEIYDVTTLKNADKGHLSFLSYNKYLNDFYETKATACIVGKNFDYVNDNQTILLKVDNPYYAYAEAINCFYTDAKEYKEFLSKSAYIDRGATIGKNCYIGHNVVIESGARIGDNCIIESNSVIGMNVVIGNNAHIFSSVSICCSTIGDNVVILSGARIGQVGFGFATNKGIHHKIYHHGGVVIGDNVEIGANTTIDRGSVGNTVIEDGCKIDNLVQIGHNVIIRKGCLIVAQVGVAGSTEVGSYCALGGQVGIAGHLKLTDRVSIAGQGGVIQDIPDAGVYGGTPAVPINDWHRQSIFMKKAIRRKEIK